MEEGISYFYDAAIDTNWPKRILAEKQIENKWVTCAKRDRGPAIPSPARE
jgi:hypothetical protein